ncbi:hypothetical protein AUJ59_02765 [Candidatus Beckwithbacteria bacterium CG1_02_47_37]|uniref:Uncharacterized protein n=2 Tax=Candidatus Beckwithiibacteriota TaxID=1752726 RepID=A0A1J4RRJ6_9BACT|nr:MAG: hypothetical protein AUJ59_02765 [Candidatus Beckwithbacteria bacterium CG1_02_47_37]PJC66678.1 MAG: hypothetical protein CO018_00690 [Candidatus Beckwithbacteria bacterium CG_4_9_14_0_2_um_filter_47_11]
MKLDIAKIVGSLSDTGWSQVHSFKPEDQVKFNSHGELLAAVSFKAKTEIDISSFGAEIIKRLQEIYYSHEAESVLKKLNQTCETLAAEFLDQVELEIVALAVWQNYLYAAKNSGGQVWLKRGEALVKLFAGEGLTTASGKLIPGDWVVAVTGQFGQLVTEGSLRAALGETSAAAVGESLTAQVHGHDNNSQASAIILKTEPEAKPAAALPKELKIFAGPHLNKRRRSILTVGLVLASIFILSLVLSGRKKQAESGRQAYQAVVDEVNYKLDEASSLLTLNPLRAKALLQESQARIKEYKEKERKPGREILDLEARIAPALEQAQREYRAEAVEWYDFNLVKDGFRGGNWDLSGKEVLVWDQTSQTAVLLNLETKAAKEIVSGEDLGRVQTIGLTDERGFIAAQDKVTVVDTAKEKIIAAVDADEWQKITTARGFGGNLYLLDASSDSQIWKYLGLEEGLSSKRSYLAGDSFDLSEAMDMAVDGSVWVLFSDGTIVKYTQGKKDAFQVIGLDQPFGEAVKIFTSPEVEHLYILDRANTRVVVVDKSGEYAAQYQWSGIAGVKDLVVSETLKKIFFLTGEKVFSLDLK